MVILIVIVLVVFISRHGLLYCTYSNIGHVLCFLIMEVPRIDIFEWLLHNAPRARYNLAFSNINGMTVKECKAFTQYLLPDDFNLGVNAQYGADELKRTLGLIYHCEPSNIVTTTGASEANFLVFSSYLNQGDEFIVEQPAYQPL